MKNVRITRKPAPRFLKEYSKLFPILCSWKYAGRLSQRQRIYQQRNDFFGKPSEELEKEWKNGKDESE